MTPINQFNSIIKFGRLVHGEMFQTPMHIRHFNSLALKLLYSNELQHLIVSVPIRHGKSFFFSTLLPAWYLIVNPTAKILLCSNTLDRAADFASEVRKLVTNFGHINNVELDPKWRSRDKFKTTSGGGLQAFGTGASIAGLGYDLGICDDIYKNQEEANNPLQRQKLSLWFSAEFLTRQLPGAKTIVVGSRRHPEDITHTLLSLNDEISSASQKWHEVLFKAIDDKGNALWPERYSLEYLNRERNKLIQLGQEHVFESLWQNNPINNGSCEWDENLVGDFLLKDLSVEETYPVKIISVDPALHKSDNGDNSVALCCGYSSSGSCTIYDGVGGRMDVGTLEDKVVELIKIHKPQGVIIETNGFQELIANSIIKKCEAEGIPCPLQGFTSKSQKEERIRTLITPLLHRGELSIKKCLMGQTILNELRQFPTASHDDHIDALSLNIGLYNYLMNITDEVYTPVRHI